MAANHTFGDILGPRWRGGRYRPYEVESAARDITCIPPSALLAGTAAETRRGLPLFSAMEVSRQWRAESRMRDILPAYHESSRYTPDWTLRLRVASTMC